MMKLEQLSDKLIENEEGFFSSSKILESISYTENGHELIHESEENSFWFDHRARCILKCVRFSGIDAILDLGGGNGHLSLFFQKNNIHSILVEPGIDGVKKAVKQGVKHVVHGTISSVSIKRESVDNLGLFDVLEHIKDDTQLLNDIYDCLRPGGKLVITVPAYQSLYSSFDKDVGHYRRYTRARLVQVMQGCGFQIDYSSYLFSFLVPPIFILRKIYPLLRTTEAKRSFGHTSKKSLIGKILKYLLHVEYLLICNLKIPFGTSCLVVANKPL